MLQGHTLSLPRSFAGPTRRQPGQSLFLFIYRQEWKQHIATRLLFVAVCLSLIIPQLFGNGTIALPSSVSSPSLATTLPVPSATNTLQRSLQRANTYQAQDAPLLTRTSTINPANGKGNGPALPSAEPPTMKAASQIFAASSAMASDQTTKTSTTASPAIHLVGKDTTGVRMEVLIPQGALDLSHATTSAGATPQGTLKITLTQLSGHFVGMRTELGEFQVRITNDQGHVFDGITLHAPATFVYHYRSLELQKLGLDANNMFMSWPQVSLSMPMTARPDFTASTTGTLTARTTTLLSSAAAIGVSNPVNQTPAKPHFATTEGNSGQLNYSYPFVVAPGPAGTAPSLAAVYSSAATNGRKSEESPADSMGEGWSLSTPSITVEGSNSTGTVWYFLNGVDNVSDRLVPDSTGSNYATEHLSYIKVKRVTAPFDSQYCFDVWDTAGNFYEFGCTHDSMQYYTDSSNNRTNYRYDLDKYVPANDGNTARQVTYSYLQTTTTQSGYYTIRDAVLKQIVYGTSSTTVGTVDFFYKGPSTVTSNGVTWVTAYGTNEGGCSAPISTTVRCDDPLTRSGGMSEPLVLSVFSLITIKSYVGTDSSTSNLDYAYNFAYTDTHFTSCTDPSTGTTAYCAGEHILNSITPTAYKAGTGYTLPGVVFGYTAETNSYTDTGHTVSGSAYKVSTNWQYLTSYHDYGSGTGETIVWHTAYSNPNGTAYYSSGTTSDNRYDPFYCDWHSTDCTSSSPFYPFYNKTWTQQAVYQISSTGTDSSALAVTTTTTTYHYLLAKTGTGCKADTASPADTDCVGDTWYSNDDSTDWQDSYSEEFRGFAEVDITSASGDLTVQKYYSTEGLNTAQSDPANYLSGSMYEEDVYQGNTATSVALLTQTLTTYAGTNSTAAACTNAYTSDKYEPCEVIPLTTKTITYNGSSNSSAPWILSTYTWDDYSRSSGLISGYYHNKLTEVTTGSNIPTETQKWTYKTTDQTVSSTVYYNVHSVTHSELDDASGTVWSCSDTTYDEGETSGLPSPAAGWPTTTKTYTTCGNSSTAIIGYIGYDSNGAVVATVDGVGAATPSLYAISGCKLSPAPAYLSASWTAGRYTNCTAYNSNGLPTDTWNALSQHTSGAYDSTQGMLLVSSTDVNNQVTTQAISYDSSGDITTSESDPGETGSYTVQTVFKSSCTASSTTPCIEEDSNTSLYSSAVTRTFYDSMGRPVETLTPGPDSGHTTVIFTVHNDAAHTVFTSEPFVVTSRTTWLDPNGATDINGVTPGGTLTVLDALGSVLSITDPRSHVTTSSYTIGTSGVSGDNNWYAITTVVDANSHESQSYDDVLGRTIYTVDYSGLSTGTLTAIKRTTTAYNVLDKPTSVTVTDLGPQAGQTITSVTTTATYDALGRMITLNDPDYGTSTYTYDADSRQLTAISGSHTIGTGYDLLGRVGCFQDATPTVNGSGACSSGSHPLAQYTYDTSVLGVQGTTDFAIGELTQSVATTYYPDGTSATVTEQYQHDLRGQEIAKTLQLALPGGWNVTNTLPTYEMTQAYNDAGQPTTTQTQVGGQTGYTFTQVYDGTTGRLTGLSNNSVASANLATLAYNSQDQISDINFLTSTGNTLANEHFTYDGNLRVTGANGTWQSGSGSSGTVFNESLAYDAVDNVISKVTTLGGVSGQSGSGGGQTENFCYDEANRLIWAGNSGSQSATGNGSCGTGSLANTLSGNNYNTSFSYTNLGQIWQGPLNGNGAQEQYLYCNSSHPHQLTGLYPIGTTCSTTSSATAVYSASYDPWGNEVSRSYGGTTATLSYDVLNRLTQWNAGNSNQDWYVYDASGSRIVQRFVNSSATNLTVYAFGLQELHYDGSGNSQGSTCYYSLGGRLLGALVYGSMQFYLTDTEGSVLTTFSNVAGSAVILGNQVYSPYGTKGYNAGSMGTAKGYTGQYADPTGLDYYNARYYDPVVGRFLSVDSVQGNAQGMDPYNYVGGNPESRTDPSGLRMLGVDGSTAWVSGGTLYISSPSSGVTSQPIHYQPVVVHPVAPRCGPCIAPPSWHPTSQASSNHSTSYRCGPCMAPSGYKVPQQSSSTKGQGSNKGKIDAGSIVSTVVQDIVSGVSDIGESIAKFNAKECLSAERCFGIGDLPAKAGMKRKIIPTENVAAKIEKTGGKFALVGLLSDMGGFLIDGYTSGRDYYNNHTAGSPNDRLAASVTYGMFHGTIVTGMSLLGAAIGSTVPFVGTAAGDIAGGLLGQAIADNITEPVMNSLMKSMQGFGSDGAASYINK